MNSYHKPYIVKGCNLGGYRHYKKVIHIANFLYVDAVKFQKKKQVDRNSNIMHFIQLIIVWGYLWCASGISGVWCWSTCRAKGLLWVHWDGVFYFGLGYNICKEIALHPNLLKYRQLVIWYEMLNWLCENYDGEIHISYDDQGWGGFFFYW
jgi:hypothetical protein